MPNDSPLVCIMDSKLYSSYDRRMLLSDLTSDIRSVPRRLPPGSGGELVTRVSKGSTTRLLSVITPRQD
jgi:hypothetical protein